MFSSHITTLLPLALWLGRLAAVQCGTLPTAQLDKATVYGITNGSVTSFFNIPFAEPPIGDLRLRLPKPIDNYNGTINATQVGAQCIQQIPPLREDMPAEMLQDVIAPLNNLPSDPRPGSEDCLNLNVIVPAGTTPGSQLPIMVTVYIFGGGFSLGSNTQFHGEVMVQRSVEMGQPIIFVGVNYRLHAFGFLGGKEVKAAGIGNIGLHDQREGLRWIKKHIAAFGGDPNKVTIWGESAGGLSVGSHLVANGGDTEGLFRAAVMSSGSLLPTGDISALQPFFDRIAADTGCADAKDKLDCLRGVPAVNLTNAAAAIPGFLGYKGLAAPQWLLHADGTFLKEPVRNAVLAGRIAHVPFITGDSLDEGTIFAPGAFNITTDAEFLDYMRSLYFPGASGAEVAPLLDLYPDDPAQGSPFGTGDENQLAPMFKRVAAFEGDFLFQSQRRSLLTLRSSKQHAWSYLVDRNPFPGVGIPHGNDILALSRGEDFLDYIIQFVATLDPDGGSNRTRYDPASRRVLSVLDGEEPLAIEQDDAREAAMEAVVALSFKYPL